MVWNGPGVLRAKDNKGKPNDIQPGEDVPNAVVDAMGKERVEKLVAKGCLSGKRNAGRPKKDEE